MQRIFIIRGFPGSGKTTYARELAESCGAEHYEADMYHMTADGYKYDKDREKDAHSWCVGMCRDALERGKKVVVSDTFTRVREYQVYMDMGVPFSVSTCESTSKSIHDVPDQVIQAMRDRWEPHTWKRQELPKKEKAPEPTEKPEAHNGLSAERLLELNEKARPVPTLVWKNGANPPEWVKLQGSAVTDWLLKEWGKGNIREFRDE